MTSSLPRSFTGSGCSLEPMYGTIRSLDQMTFDETGESIAEARKRIFSRMPSGYELISAKATVGAGGQEVSVHGIARATDVREVEAADIAGLRAATPPGWQLIALRTY